MMMWDKQRSANKTEEQKRNDKNDKERFAKDKQTDKKVKRKAEKGGGGKLRKEWNVFKKKNSQKVSFLKKAIIILRK